MAHDPSPGAARWSSFGAVQSHAVDLTVPSAGVNIKVVSERLGHASVAFTLDTYAHVMPGQQKEAAAAVSALLENSVTNL